MSHPGIEPGTPCLKESQKEKSALNEMKLNYARPPSERRKAGKSEIRSEKIFDFPELILISDFSCAQFTDVQSALKEYR